MRGLKRFLMFGGGLYLAAVGLLYVFQRELIYDPDQTPYVPPSHYAMLADVREVELVTADGLRLTAWYSPAPAGRPTILMLHGKGSSLRSQRYRIQHFRDAQMGVLLPAYRGYSGNDGEPSEQGLYADARAALDWLRAEGVAESSIAVYGISLGTGVATGMAAERRLGAVVLEAPYTSLADVAAHRFPLVPVDWLLEDRFDSLARMEALAEPVLIMHGDGDRVIPQRLGWQLYQAARSPKAGFWPRGVGHNDLFDRGGFAVAVDFIERSVAAAG